ncbi:hypothetical protein [Sphingobacterium bovistauri]|uniref:Uncharacterized protein n=1 Tax=Sphingobacterium bovistauri TaxID=2781959 RepID=A0ABS7Z6P5_9SPHI|nr:hypothetical protein [Sphingobacterium bovistauri]MCA5005232.1 hypothetical protein [Sphingobacterium bovistauri]
MRKLYDIFDEESKEKAYLIYVLVALKMTRKIYHQLPEKIQQIADEATIYWTNNGDFEISEDQMDKNASYITKLRATSKKRYDINADLELKVVELSLNPHIDFDYFDYHLDWMYEVGNKVGFSNQKLDQLIDETINEIKN